MLSAMCITIVCVKKTKSLLLGVYNDNFISQDELLAIINNKKTLMVKKKT